LDAPLDPRQTASEKAATLRERAQRYRELAETLYDRDIILEVEALVSELEDEAAGLEVGRFPYFRAA
jgi:hypothetical protein